MVLVTGVNMKSSLLGLLSFGLFIASPTVFSEVVDHPTEIIIAFKKGASLEKASLSSFNSFKELARETEARGALYKLELPQTLLSSQYINDLNKREDILWAEANPVFIGDPRESTPNDPEFSKQYHHKIIQSEKAWDLSTGVAEVIVAATDDGFMLDHEDLAGIYYKNEGEVEGNGIDDDENGYIDDVIGWNFNEGTNNPDVAGYHGGHGTHVAGIIGADFNNGLGVVGHGTKIKVMPLKFYGTKSWTGAMILETYKYAADNGAKIITTSYNVDGMSAKKVYQEAVAYAYDKGLIIFNSAGNGNAEQSARTKNTQILLVASTQSGSDVSKHDLRSRFSNYGIGVDIAAPGNPIYSTSKSGKYVDMSGTSMAAPNAAGVAALIWSVNPDYTREQVLATLMKNSTDVDGINGKYKNKLGNGRIDSFKALSQKIKAPTVRQAWYADGNKTLNIHLQGILNPKSLTRGGIIIEDSKGQLIESDLKALNKYEMGTNILRFQLKAPRGSYRARMNPKAFKGPFGQELDGDRDGEPGGEFVLDFEIR